MPCAAAACTRVLDVVTTRSTAATWAKWPSMSDNGSTSESTWMGTPRVSDTASISAAASPYCKLTNVSPGIERSERHASKGVDFWSAVLTSRLRQATPITGPPFDRFRYFSRNFSRSLLSHNTGGVADGKSFQDRRNQRAKSICEHCTSATAESALKVAPSLTLALGKVRARKGIKRAVVTMMHALAVAMISAMQGANIKTSPGPCSVHTRMVLPLRSSPFHSGIG